MGFKPIFKEKSLDARGRFPMYVLRYVVYEKGDVIPMHGNPKYKNTKSGLSAIIIESRTGRVLWLH